MRTAIAVLLFSAVAFAQPVGSSTAKRIITGTGVPSAGQCAVLSDVGKVYVRKDAKAANSSSYTCAQTGNGVFGWELPGGNVGLGDFVGPGSSTQDNLVSFGDGTGKAGKDSGLTTANTSDAISKKHTQNTDTGTTATCYQLDTDAATPGPKLCADGAGGYSVKDKDDNVLMTVDVNGTLTLGDGSKVWNMTGITDDAAPSAPGSANQFTAWLDRTLGVPGYILNGGSAFYAATAAQKVTFTGPTAARAYALPDAAATISYTVASGAKALATAEIASQACTAAQTDTATGAATTDTVVFTPNADITAVTGYAPVTTGGLAIYPYVTANTVNFKVCNPTSGAITPGAVTLNWRVVR